MADPPGHREGPPSRRPSRTDQPQRLAAGHRRALLLAGRPRGRLGQSAHYIKQLAKYRQVLLLVRHGHPVKKRGHRVFSELNGEGDIGADGSMTGTFEIGAASVDTRNSKRDTHLRSAEFFDAQAHPRIAFTARSARVDESGGLAVSGDLEVAGKSRPLSLVARVSEASADSATLAADVDVDRSDYGMTWNQLGMVKGPATVSVTARFTRQPG